MRKTRELLRLKYEPGRSHREIAGSLVIANSTVSDYVRRASAAGISWPLPEGVEDAALEAALYPAPPPSRVARPEPEWPDVHRELQRHKGVTLQLLWLEYRAAHPNGYGYSWFCEHYRAWRGHIDVALRQVYRAGEKAFVDYASPKFPVVDRGTGEEWDAMVFVGVLGASNYTFVDVTRSRALPDWTMSHVRMFEFWRGVPGLVIPDNEKAAVHKASRYEPVLKPRDAVFLSRHRRPYTRFRVYRLVERSAARVPSLAGSCAFRRFRSPVPPISITDSGGFGSVIPEDSDHLGEAEVRSGAGGSGYVVEV